MALILGLLFGVLIGAYESAKRALEFGISIFLLMMILGLVLSAVTTSRTKVFVTDYEKQSSIRGIYSSIRKNIYSDGLVLLIMYLLLTPFLFFLFDVFFNESILILLIYACVVWPIIFGSVEAIKHFVIRFILQSGGHFPFSMPWQDKKVIAFLDSMDTRLLLKRTLGSWRFVHKSLQEHFASKSPIVWEEDRFERGKLLKRILG